MHHHYVPQFYLKNWTSSQDGRMWRYRRETNGCISEKRVVPRGTAFEVDLYAVASPGAHEPVRHPNVIETEFFMRIDCAGAAVLPKLIATPPRPLTRAERLSWATFVNSLFERRRDTVLSRLDEAPRIAAESAASVMARVTPENRGRMAEALASFDVATASKNMVRELMVREIRDAEVNKYIAAADWTVFTATSCTFITTDAPLLINAGSSSAPFHVLTLALSPNKLFVMHPQSWKAQESSAPECIELLAFAHNFLLVQAGCRCVYSDLRITDDGPIHLRSLIETRLRA